MAGNRARPVRYRSRHGTITLETAAKLCSNVCEHYDFESHPQHYVFHIAAARLRDHDPVAFRKLAHVLRVHEFGVQLWLTTAELDHLFRSVRTFIDTHIVPTLHADVLLAYTLVNGRLGDAERTPPAPPPSPCPIVTGRIAHLTRARGGRRA